jgi:UDP-galactopyranose mutase
MVSYCSNMQEEFKTIVNQEIDLEIKMHGKIMYYPLQETENQRAYKLFIV